MSDIEHISAHDYPLEELPIHEALIDGPVNPAALMRARDIGHQGLQLLVDLRPDHTAMREIDGFAAANARVLGGRTMDELGAARGPAEKSGQALRNYFFRNVDASDAYLEVRDIMPGESVEHYLTHTDRTLRRDGNNSPQSIRLPRPKNVPGSRFTNQFPPDTDGVIMGLVAINDLEGAHDGLENQRYLLDLFNGMLPNFDGISSLDRTNPLTLSYSVERFAAAHGHGKEWQDVIAQYREPLNKQINFWMRGRSYLEGITHDRGAVSGRQMLLAGPQHDIVFRHFSDINPDLATLRGLRPESAGEDAAFIRRVLGDSPNPGDYAKLTTDVRAACEWQDFADWELGDYRHLETIRTTDIAPVHLQAGMLHHLLMTDRIGEFNKLADTLNRRFWVDIDEDHGYYADLTQDGKPTMALHAAQALPLLVGGVVPPDRKLKLANTWRDALLREHGFLISAGVSGQQWSGDPSKTGDRIKDGFVERIHERMYGKPLWDESTEENRAWPMMCALLVEAFTTAAVEEQMAGRDPDPFLEVAELARVGTVEGISQQLDQFKYVGEKYNVLHPRNFVNGGEYGTTPETAQRGFGMSIGGFRMAAGRGLQAEVNFPDEYSWRWNTLSRSAGGLLVAHQTLKPVTIF